MVVVALRDVIVVARAAFFGGESYAVIALTAISRTAKSFRRLWAAQTKDHCGSPPGVPPGTPGPPAPHLFDAP